jgi:tRNA threonylcarbamoyladenosine biosynthesis protein TsaE
MIELESSSPEGTERIAAALARELRLGDVVTVAGDLGTGKTTFIRGACRQLGVTAPVTSPTYTIGNRYRGDVDVSHLDLYRFSALTDSEWSDLERYFEDAVVFVEWPEAGAGFLPPARAEVRLQHAQETLRLITLSSAEKSLEKRVLSLVDPRV